MSPSAKPLRNGKPRVDLSVFLGVAVLLVFAYMLLFPSRGGMAEDAKRLCCAENLRKLGVAFRAYADANGGFLPSGEGAAGLEQLRGAGLLPDSKAFFCPNSCSLKELPASPLALPERCYRYSGAGLNLKNMQTPGAFPLACDCEGAHDAFGNVLFADGFVKGLSGSAWLERLKAERKEP